MDSQTSQQSALTPKQNETRTLWCLIDGDFIPFTVSGQSTANINDLKELVHVKGINDNERILAKDLVLWKVFVLQRLAELIVTNSCVLASSRIR
jgi:Crinkler effector protein N-terminal domain